MPSRFSTVLDSTAAWVEGITDTGDLVVGAQVIKIQGPPPGDHPCYNLIGRVASAWTHLEYVLDEIIWEMSDLHPTKALCITGQLMGPISRYKAILALGAHSGLFELAPGLRTKINQLKTDTGGLSDKRNRIVHDPWFVNTEMVDGALTKRVVQLKSLPPGEAPVSETEVTDTITKIRRLVVRVCKLQVEICEWLSALRGTQP